MKRPRAFQNHDNLPYLCCKDTAALLALLEGREVIVKMWEEADEDGPSGYLTDHGIFRFAHNTDQGPMFDICTKGGDLLMRTWLGNVDAIEVQGPTEARP